MLKRTFLGLALLLVLTQGCIDDHRNSPTPVAEDPATFTETASADLGGTASSEISAYDPVSKRLFVVNNETTSKVEVLNLSAYPTVTKEQAIDVSSLSGGANSVAVSGGKLAIALEAVNKQQNGNVLVVNTSTLSVIKQVPVGALPDMVTFSPDGAYIVTANEGEPSADYKTDPVGSVSIINVADNYSVKTLTFESFAGSQGQLAAGGFRIYGPNATFAQDIEPEYVAVSPDSKKAWVTLQENNGMAEVDLVAGTILRIVPFGTKDYSVVANAIDPSDRDSKIELRTAPVKSFFLPDAITYFSTNGANYVITADEGDAREYTAFDEQVRVGSLTLDATVFPTGAALKQNTNLGRLRVTSTAGNTGGVYTSLFGFGGRGFSIYNASTGQRIYEAGKTLEEKVIAANLYDDDRSDDKGVEPEGVTVGLINNRPVAFVGMERADAIAVYDVSNPDAPQFLQLFKTGDAPEGVLFVPAANSPNGRSMLVVSSEGDGMVKIYQPNRR
ncbi:choice-of-anchor I family protein [Spirosoma fluviale]|uniref:40-residue YVTN family beta-propeller repeat-containing protein n=1 Tax=Spirosoma fluviale TaxID=1597977 RepID=A0A286GV39_9BACT|nr:choice-of-anchor I family protein [Spirosoma fluviale]SOD99046.1 40-residue YVTN family beta-propeller repeat-containing protein [Spirosoma fluviale]